MTTTSKPKNKALSNRKLYSTLVNMSEPDLMRLRNSVKAVRKELRLILSPTGESVKAVRVTQQLLKMWSIQINRSLAAKQTKDTNSELSNWDNEGGALDPMQEPRSFSEMTETNSTVVLESVEPTKSL